MSLFLDLDVDEPSTRGGQESPEQRTGGGFGDPHGDLAPLFQGLSKWTDGTTSLDRAFLYVTHAHMWCGDGTVVT